MPQGPNALIMPFRFLPLPPEIFRIFSERHINPEISIISVAKLTKPPKKTRDESRNEKLLSLIRVLRDNSRMKTNGICSAAGMPITGVQLAFSDAYLIGLRCCSMIDFNKLGYFVGAFFMIKPLSAEKRPLVEEMISMCPSINSAVRMKGNRFLVEARFRNMAELADFRQALEDIAEVSEHEIVEELKREGFVPAASMRTS